MMILEVVDGLVKRHMINEDKDPKKLEINK